MVVPHVEYDQGDGQQDSHAGDDAHANEERQGDGTQYSSDDCSVLRHFSAWKRPPHY